MNKRTLLSLVAAASVAISATAYAASPTSYQVTGAIMEVNDSMIVVMKGKEKFQVARDSSTKVTGDLKVGDKVTVHYTMTAKEIEAKADKTTKKDDKTAASPSPKK